MKGLVVFKSICFLVSLFTVLDAQTLDREVNAFEFQVDRIKREKLSEKPCAFGVGVGYVKPERIDWTFWLVANGRYKFSSKLAVELEVGYWRRRFQALYPILFSRAIELKVGHWWRSESIFEHSSISDFSVGGHMLLLSQESERLQVFIGGGMGVHFLKDNAGFLGDKSSKTKVKFGVRLLSGIELDVAGSFSVFGAARFDLVSEINQFKVYGGLRYKF